jgi:hypothetical protein
VRKTYRFSKDWDIHNAAGGECNIQDSGIVQENGGDDFKIVYLAIPLGN